MELGAGHAAFTADSVTVTDRSNSGAKSNCDLREWRLRDP